MAEQKWTTVSTAGDVTSEVLSIVKDQAAKNKKADLSAVFAAVEGTELQDGSLLDIGPREGSAAVEKIRRELKKKSADAS